jgi:flavin reductase (DIM6/NTAB) family NADH-FMN oxidoreductase RutF
MPNETARALRNSFGQFATGVCVVTAFDQDGGPFGLTVNSFSSVSLDPPLILWSLDRGSDTMPAFAAAQAFTVNVLGVDAQALSQRLSRKGGHALNPEEWTPGATGAPVLAQAIAYFDCTVWGRHDGGDHVILIGQVMAHGRDAGPQPLLYFQGRYRTLAAD